MNVKRIALIMRLAVPHMPASDRRATLSEVELVVTEATARREGARCLRCDLDFGGEAGV